MSTPRYLTAQKISLLILTRLYCSSILPTSATIPILSFILSSSLAPTSSSARAPRPLPTDQDRGTFSIDVFEDVLQAHASNVPGRTVLDLFLKHMWEMNTFDALHALFDNILELINTSQSSSQSEDAPEHISLSKTSPLGIFVRRAHLEFSRLQFDDSMKLWLSFIKYRAPTAQWTRRLAGLASSGVDAVVSEMGLGPGHDIYGITYGHLHDEESGGDITSLDDLDGILEFQLNRLQKFGDRVPDSMRVQLRKWVNSPSITHRQAHLVQFFDSWKAGDYTSSFENLHRYYDYAVQSQDKMHYQYALLHMAILQADFGCFGEAVSAINETIATARENQDMTCLSFSLSWLNHMARAYPKQMRGAGYMSMLGSERDALTFLKTKAKETKMYNLLGATLLNEAKLYLATGESIPRAIEHLYQSMHINIKENIGTDGSQMNLTATLYSRVGLPHLACAHCDLLLDCYSHSCSIDERVRASVRRAFIMAQSGQIDEAIAILSGLEGPVLASLRVHQYVFLCMGLIKFRRAVRRSDWQTCENLLQYIKPPTDSTSESMDPELSFLQHEVYIEYLMAKGLFSTAFNLITTLAQSLKNENADILQRVSTLLMKAHLFRSMGEPERGFSVALRAASISYRARLMPCLWTSVGLLGNILNALGEFAGAKRLIESVLPQASEGVDDMLIGMLYSHLADSHMGLAGPSNKSTSLLTHTHPLQSPSSRIRSTNLAKAELFIDRARKYFKKSEYLEGECEQLMKKALMAKMRGDEKLAEEWAQNHNKVLKEATSKIGSG